MQICIHTYVRVCVKYIGLCFYVHFYVTITDYRKIIPL